MKQRLLFILSVFLLSACAYQINPISGQKRAYAYKWADEVKLGKENDPAIVQEFGLMDNPALAKYIEELGQEILKESHLRRSNTPAEFKNTPFTFRLLDSPVVNAFALPGGFVYITRGLLTHLNNEAQLAVVLGHEIGHVAGRHHSKRALQQKAGQIALMGGAVLGEMVFNLPGQEMMNLGSKATGLLFLKHSRDDETESDRVGVEYAAKRGYKTDEASEFFVSLKRISEQHGGVPSLLSSHPDPGDREQNMKKLHQQWKAKGLEQTKLEDKSYLKRIEGMIVGENPRNGFVENGTYYHPELTFQFSVPTDWQLVNEPSRVIMVSKDQKGVILMTLSGARSPEEAVLAVINSEGMQKVETGGPTNNNGIPGFYGHANFESQGQKLGLLVSAVNYKNKVFQFVAYTDSASFKAYNPAFVQPYQSFTKLTDSSKLSVQPTRIKLVTATEDKPFSSFLTKPLPIGTKELDWAIINQVELNETITKGTVLKLY